MMLGDENSLVQVNYRMIAQVEPVDKDEYSNNLEWVMSVPHLKVSNVRHELLDLFINSNQSLAKSSMN